MDLKEKISFECERYFDYLLLNTPADLILRAEEIAVKKGIYGRLTKDYDKIPDAVKAKMEITENLADYIYLKYKNQLEIKDGDLTSLCWTKVLVNF